MKFEELQSEAFKDFGEVVQVNSTLPSDSANQGYLFNEYL
jgi:ureidoglycolate hydrolase